MLPCYPEIHGEGGVLIYTVKLSCLAFSCAVQSKKNSVLLPGFVPKIHHGITVNFPVY